MDAVTFHMPLSAREDSSEVSSNGEAPVRVGLTAWVGGVNAREMRRGLGGRSDGTE